MTDRNAEVAAMQPIPFAVDIPFVQHLGIELLEQSPQRALIRLARKAEHSNSWGSAHGGVVMTMLDLVMACAVRGHHGVAGASVLTVDMSVGFMQPGLGEILAEGRVLSAGRSTTFCEAETRDTQGKLLAKAMGTFKMLEKRQ